MDAMVFVAATPSSQEVFAGASPANHKISGEARARTSGDEGVAATHKDILGRVSEYFLARSNRAVSRIKIVN